MRENGIQFKKKKKSPVTVVFFSAIYIPLSLHLGTLPTIRQWSSATHRRSWVKPCPTRLKRRPPQVVNSGEHFRQSCSNLQLPSSSVFFPLQRFGAPCISLLVNVLLASFIPWISSVAWSLGAPSFSRNSIPFIDAPFPSSHCSTSNKGSPAKVCIIM